MRRAVWIAVIAVLVFGALLIARFPASWAASWLPPAVRCERLGGTVWRGRCAGLTVNEDSFDSARWTLHPRRLFTGRVAADVILMKGALDVRGEIEFAPSGSLLARNVRAFVPLDRAVLPRLPTGNLRGMVQAQLARLAMTGKTITQIEGRIEAHDLVQGGGASATRLGDYVLTFPAAPAATEPVGALEDIGGPLDVAGTLRLTREPGFVLEGVVAARAEASPQLARQLEYLGRPDSAGRRPFSVAGTF